MNEEEKTITTNEPAAEKQTKPAKPKRTDEEKLQECYEKRDRRYCIRWCRHSDHQGNNGYNRYFDRRCSSFRSDV